MHSPGAPHAVTLDKGVNRVHVVHAHGRSPALRDLSMTNNACFWLCCAARAVSSGSMNKSLGVTDTLGHKSVKDKQK